MFLIHPPNGVPVSTVPQILRLANKSQRTAPLIVSYFRVEKSEAFVKEQARKRSSNVEQSKTNLFDTTEKLVERIKKVEYFDLFDRVSDKKFASPISTILSQVTFDEDESTCVNLVFQVRYRFFW
jgi:hypothetical protein